jgi:CO/xanthine dehydrogenase FAD-binding subunit
MNKPDYIAPTDLQSALAILSERTTGAQLISGGTDLIPRMRNGSSNPSLLVDLRNLDLNRIALGPEIITLGARVTHSQILRNAKLCEALPALWKACTEMAGPPIRNRGTLGGNIVNASPAADAVPPLLVHDAQLVLVKQAGERVVSLADFFTGPGRTILDPDEILIEIRVPVPSSQTMSSFTKMGKRQAMAISIVSAAARLSLDSSGRVESVRVALGSVGPTPLLVDSIHDLLVGKKLSADLIKAAGMQAAEYSSPISDLRASGDYRRQMVSVLVKRLLQNLWNELDGDGYDGTN